MTRAWLARGALGLALLGVMMVGGRRLLPGDSDEGCGPGFARAGPRCLPGVGCPPPLRTSEGGCEVPLLTVTIPRTTAVIGPSDWEAQGVVHSRTVTAGPLRLDAFEVSVGNAHCPECPLADPSRYDERDRARAASAITRSEAQRYCAARGGRLPTEDEWLVAAAGSAPRRYPWGDTGAVCRRAAFGLVRGPCASGAAGPDTVAAHPEGQTPLGVYDMAGNVAEWVDDPPGVRGGSFESELVAELRTWARREVPAGATSGSIGFRCAYDVDVR